MTEIEPNEYQYLKRSPRYLIRSIEEIYAEIRDLYLVITDPGLWVTAEVRTRPLSFELVWNALKGSPQSSERSKFMLSLPIPSSKRLYHRYYQWKPRPSSTRLLQDKELPIQMNLPKDRELFWVLFDWQGLSNPLKIIPLVYPID